MANNYVEIVIGILQRDDKVCLSVRKIDQSFSGRWEFPGGKVEANETLIEALTRECQEELKIDTENWLPLIIIPWQYKNIMVRLNVFTTFSFVGEPVGNEGQIVTWIEICNLASLRFPEANRGIITALMLADRYMISGNFDNVNDALSRLDNAFRSGIKLCQLRVNSLESSEFIPFAQQAVKCAHSVGAKMLLNGKVTLLNLVPEADGIQLASQEIFEHSLRPIAKGKLLGASTHTLAEIEQALLIEADFILLSPVKETCSHLGMAGIGWQVFEKLVRDIPTPVFALGGMRPSDVSIAKEHGAQGVATTSGFWPAC